MLEKDDIFSIENEGIISHQILIFIIIHVSPYTIFRSTQQRKTYQRPYSHYRYSLLGLL